MKNLFALLLLHAIPLVIEQMKSYSILHFDFIYAMSTEKKKKKPLFLYFCLEHLAALYNPSVSANRSNNITKHREVFQKTQHTECTRACKGVCDKLAGKRNRTF